MKQWNNCIKLNNEYWRDFETGQIFCLNDLRKIRKLSHLDNILELKKRLNNNYNIISNELCSYTQHSKLNSYKDKSILIVGGGPSSSLYKWENIKVDYIWTCNHFYLNKNLRNKKFHLILLGNQVDLNSSNRQLRNYIKIHKPLCCREVCGLSTKFTHSSIESYFKNDFVYYKTSHYCSLGVIPRMICFALSLNIKNIYFIGFDGKIPKNEEFKHSFEIGKNIDKYSFFIIKRDFVLFWDYILNLIKPICKFYNLGENYQYNMMSDISKQEFPLNQDINNKLRNI